MRVGRHLHSDYLPRLDVNDDAFDPEDLIVARKRILPGLEFGMSHLRPDEIHIARSARVMLESGDLFRIRRPDNDRPVTPGPPGVVGCIAVILHAIRRELPLLAIGDLFYPEVIVADERGK